MFPVYCFLFRLRLPKYDIMRFFGEYQPISVITHMNTENTQALLKINDFKSLSLPRTYVIWNVPFILFCTDKRGKKNRSKESPIVELPTFSWESATNDIQNIKQTNELTHLLYFFHHFNDDQWLIIIIFCTTLLIGNYETFFALSIVLVTTNDKIIIIIIYQHYHY